MDIPDIVRELQEHCGACPYGIALESLKKIKAEFGPAVEQVHTAPPPVAPPIRPPDPAPPAAPPRPAAPETRECKKCHVAKPLSAFSQWKGRPTDMCQACRSEISSKNRALGHEKAREAAPAAAANPESTGLANEMALSLPKGDKKFVCRIKGCGKKYYNKIYRDEHEQKPH